MVPSTVYVNGFLFVIFCHGRRKKVNQSEHSLEAQFHTGKRLIHTMYGGECWTVCNWQVAKSTVQKCVSEKRSVLTWLTELNVRGWKYELRAVELRLKCWVKYQIASLSVLNAKQCFVPWVQSISYYSQLMEFTCFLAYLIFVFEHLYT